MSEETITIPISEYAALLRAKAELMEMKGGQPIRCYGSKFKFRHDPALVTFLNANCLSMRLDDLVEALHREFGKERSPSRSSLGRYVQRYRRQLGLS